MKVGFIGLGSMGAAMSRNLIKAGQDLVVYNRTRSRSQEMQSLGAKVADTAAEAAVGVEVLITMLADDRAVQDVIFEPGAAIEALSEGAVHISMSTISVDLSRRLAK
jgi:3-hydroxyisobutyrate dehydrogenase-like beta-hydroxyacid dehydrogenase